MSFESQQLFDKECTERAVGMEDLPPNPERRNEDRSESARESLRVLVAASGAEMDDVISDMLCNLMHFADRYGVDFDSELSRAEMHYRAEVGKRPL